MSKAKQILPKTLVQLICETVYDYHLYILDNCVLPKFVYYFTRVYVTMATCLLFTNFHQSGTGLKPLEVFLNLYATELNEQWAMINFVIDMLVFGIMYISIIYFSILYTYRNYLSKFSSYFNVIMVEVIMPFMMLTTGSQIGNNVGLLYANIKNYTIWIYTMISLAWVLLSILCYNVFLSAYIPFIPGRSVAMSSSLQAFELNIITAVRILARGANATPGTNIAIAFRVCIAALLAYGIFMIIFWNIYHSRNYSAFIASVFCAGLVLDIFAIFLKLDWVIRLILFFGIILIGYFVIGFILKSVNKKIMAIFTAIENEEISFEDAYPKINNTYLRHCYEAFKSGHPFMLTFKPLVYGSHNENTNPRIWRFYLRVLAIYNSRIYDLMNASQELKRLGYTDIKTQLFLRGIDHMIEIRSRKISKPCSLVLKNIQANTRSLRSTLVKYWQAIQSGEAGTAYAYGASAQHQMDEIEKSYVSTLTKWPNVPNIYKHYSRFLNYICFNRLKSEIYASAANMSRTVDFAEIQAKAVFPMIPVVLPDVESLLNPAPQQQNQDQAPSMLSSGSVGTDLERNEQEQEELTAQNTLYEMGKSCNVPINRAITIFTVLAFIILFVLGIVLTNILTLQKNDVYETLLQFLSSFTSLLFYTSRPVYRILSIIAEAENISYNTSKVIQMLGADDELDDVVSPFDQITSDISALWDNIDSLERLRSEASAYIGNVSYILTSIKVKTNYLYINKKGAVKNNKNFIPLMSAITTHASFISEFSKDFIANPIPAKKERFFMRMLENNYRIMDVITSLSNYVTDHMLEYTKDFVSTALTMTAVFSAISVLIFPIVLVLLRIQAIQYGHIIQSMHKIPSIVIIQHISELTPKTDDEKNNNAEAKLQIQDSHGIPTLLVSGLSVVCIIVFIAISFINYYMLTRSINKFKVLPYQMKNGALLANHIYDNIANLKRVWAFLNGKKFNADTDYMGTNVFPDTADKIESGIDDALFGVADNLSYGYLLVPSETRQLFFDTEDTNGTSYHDLFVKFGYVFSLEVDVSEMHYITTNALDRQISNKDNDRIAMWIHYNDYHLSTGILDKLVTNTFVDMKNVIESQQAIAIATPVIGFLILTAFLSVFIYYQMQVLRTFRFTIMTLSMLDQKFIQTNERLLDIAAGNFTSDGQSDSIPSHYIECLKESSQDAIIICNKNFDIIESNGPAKQLSSLGANAKNIEDIMGINDELRKAADSSTAIMLNFKKQFKAPNGKMYEMEASATQTNNGEIIIILHRDHANEQLKEERQKTEENLKNLIYRILPHDFREAFQEQPFKTVLFENILILAVKAKNIVIKEEEDDEGIERILTMMDQFNKAVVDASKKSDDCALVKKHNFMSILVFNIKSQKKTMQQPLAMAIDVVKAIKEECDKNQIVISAVAVASKNCIIGIPSLNKATFNIFAPELQTCMTGIDTAGDNELVCHRLDREIPQNLREKVRQGEEFSHIMISDC